MATPTDLNSLQFLLFEGFAEGPADDIWQAWSTKGERRDWVIDDALYYIRSKAQERDAIGAEDDWDDALHYMDLSEDLRQRILNPTFDSIRLTQCACYWAQDSIHEALLYIQNLPNRIEKRQAEKVSTYAVETGFSPGQIDGRVLFFKGGTQAQLQQCIDEDGSIRLGALHSCLPTDFHPEKGTCLYLTKHYDVALLYARYVEERVPLSDAAVLHIAIPKALICDAREIYGDDWYDLVWNSRNTKLHLTTYKQLPPHLRQYEDAEILIGQPCNDSTHKIASTSTKSELSAMRLPNGGEASQIVIQSVSRQIDIAHQCRGFIRIVPCKEKLARLAM